jgi:hypothetical protein
VKINDANAGTLNTMYAESVVITIAMNIFENTRRITFDTFTDCTSVL